MPVLVLCSITRLTRVVCCRARSQSYFGLTDLRDTNVYGCTSGVGGAIAVAGAANTQAPDWCTQEWCQFTSVVRSRQ